MEKNHEDSITKQERQATDSKTFAKHTNIADKRLSARLSKQDYESV